jgi:hypothetical protein
MKPDTDPSPHPEERRVRRVSKDEMNSSWFETRAKSALLTMSPANRITGLDFIGHMSF